MGFGLKLFCSLLIRFVSCVCILAGKWPLLDSAGVDFLTRGS